MKQSIQNTRLLILIGLLIIIAAYYFVVQGPIAKETEKCKANISFMESELSVFQPKIVQKKQWEEELDEIRSNADGEIQCIAEYDNLNHIISEFNAIFNRSDPNYSISFSDPKIAENIASRDIRVSYTSKTYDDAIEILKIVHDSPYLYVLRDVSINYNRPATHYFGNEVIDFFRGTTSETVTTRESYGVSFNMTDYEFHP